jgi:hypothetical protein
MVKFIALTEDRKPPMSGDFEKEDIPTAMLTESPNETDQGEGGIDDSEGRFVLLKDHGGEDNTDMGQARGLRTLHPYTRPLTISDLESVVALENAAFDNEQERCSREKVSSSSFRIVT